jgi:hypothetical protein
MSESKEDRENLGDILQFHNGFSQQTADSKQQARGRTLIFQPCSLPQTNAQETRKRRKSITRCAREGRLVQGVQEKEGRLVQGVVLHHGGLSQLGGQGCHRGQLRYNLLSYRCRSGVKYG